MMKSCYSPQDIVSKLKEFLISQQEAGIEWIKMPNANLRPLIIKVLNRSIQNCQRCRLASTRTHTVFGEGNLDTRLMFIGEAPGVEEDHSGRPFIGKAGELLTKIIEAINLSRTDVFITSVVKCRPPENRTPLFDEIDACKPIIELQIEAICPAIICTLGSVATQTLLRINEPITKLRGRFHDYKGIPVMPTFHPAYLLRNPKAKKLVWEDMQKIQALYQKKGG